MGFVRVGSCLLLPPEKKVAPRQCLVAEYPPCYSISPSWVALGLFLRIVKDWWELDD